MKKTLTLFATASMICASQAAVVIGDFINVDYSTATGTPNPPTTAPGPVATTGNTWTTTNGGFQPNNLSTSTGTAVNIGTFTANGTSGGGGSFGPGGTDPLVGDYVFTNDNAAGDVALPNGGPTVGAYRRATIFGADLSTDQVWNLTFITRGDTAGQGAQIYLYDGTGYQSISNTGTTALTGPTPSYVAGDNFGTFTNVSPTESGAVEFEFFIVNTDGGTIGALNGLQLELVDIVPEPSSALLSLCGLGLLLRRKR